MTLMGQRLTPRRAVHGFPSLRLLDLSGCGLDEWSQVAAYGLLPGLQELVLDTNPLTRVDPPHEGSFSALRRFSLTATRYCCTVLVV